MNQLRQLRLEERRRNFAANTIHRELMSHEVVGDKDGILGTARTSAGNLRCLRTFRQII